MPNNNSNFDDLLKYINESNKSVEELEKQLNRLNESIWSHQTSLERIKELQEKINNYTEERLLTEKAIVDVEKKINQLQNEGKTDSEEYNSLLNERIELDKKNEELKKKEVENLKDRVELTKELNRRQEEGVTFLDDWQEKYERNTKVFRKGTKEIADGAKGIYSAITNTLKPWSKANDEAMKYARTMGMSQKTADAYLSKTVSWASNNNIGILFNKSTDELIKMQSKYSEVLGRNVQLTSEQKKDMLAMEAFLGEDGMTDIANNLENFGMGMSDSAEFVKKQLDTATKSGIVASKLTKTIRENIKMAQNYTFKNGLDGLARMAKKAIELKTDMSLVEGFANNVSTVEGAITTGAKLQVLGGNYAMGSDPLSMMYESLNDMEGLFNRAVGMAQGKVFYNNETGNFEMGAMDRYMMKQAATAMGVDPNKMLDVAFRQASLGRIEDQIRLNSDISGDKDMVDLVKNLATWDNGKAIVRVDGQDKLVSDLNSTDKEKLVQMQKTDSENLQEMAINLRSMESIMSGTNKEINNEQANILKGIGEGFNNWLKDHEGLLNGFSKILAWGNTFNGVRLLLSGIWGTTIGIARTIKGSGNLFSSTHRNIAGTANGVTRGIKLNQLGVLLKKGGLRSTETVYNYNGHNYTLNSNGRFENSAGRELSETYSNRITRHGTQVSQKGAWTNLAKSVGKGVKTGVGIGAFAAAISIGTDIATGEFQKDMGRSIGRAAGPMVGSIIGGIFGPVGSLVGGTLGRMVTSAIHDASDRVRNKLRDDIANNLMSLSPTLAGLFSGDNAIQANLNKRQLRSLEKALDDKRLEEDELSRSALRKLRNNGDLSRIREAGVTVTARFAGGGILNGKSHSQGGMPILGSNMEVEGGEYVVNKKATRENLPLLQKINNGDYRMTAIEPLGKQLKVNSRQGFTETTNPRGSKIEIEPISINLSGTIKLDTGNKQFDISNEILNNPQLITKLTEMINKQINILDNGAYVKNTFKQKII